MVGLAIIGCSQDPKIEYIEVEVPGDCQECPGYHIDEHNCPPDCDRDHENAVLPCNDAIQCSIVPYIMVNNWTDIQWARCTDLGCGDKQYHYNALRDTFRSVGLNDWVERGMPLHKVVDGMQSNCFVMVDRITDTQHWFMACIGNDALEAAYNAAMENLELIHPSM